ncbi:MAG: hypothetical protein E7376_01020 [Clostridiales bacterium]|nr:hypothetical protein [Clostridiales bacterium]
MNNKFLWNELNLNSSCTTDEVNEAYKSLQYKNENATLAWKVLSDKYYKDVYKTHKDMKYVYEAGFFVDKYECEKENYYNLNLLTTPVGKLLNNLKDKTCKNPVVLLTTGGFAPLHEGHFLMMDFARSALQQQGYEVIGGYFSPSHNEYFQTKPFSTVSSFERVYNCQKQIKDSDWLMIDPWECLYTKTYLNFTDVINRLELYLQKHVNKKIKVAYVFGGDNAEFMYCFQNQGIGICVEREGQANRYNKLKKLLQSSNNIFIDNKSKASTCSSRAIREKLDLSYQLNYDNINGSYVIRDESIFPFKNFLNFISCEKLELLIKKFIKKLSKEIYNAFDKKINIYFLDLKSQLNIASLELKDKRTISLDAYYKGTYNIETSRLFDISDPQFTYLELNDRDNKKPISKQISKIKSGKYVLVDDDSATGKTIRDIISKLPNNVMVDDVYLLAKQLNKKIFDIVDLRDFILGGKNGGLLVRLPNGKFARAPYIVPYVCLKSRASISPLKEFNFSLKIWELNKWFFMQFEKDVPLSVSDVGFKNLMNYIGFDDITSFLKICDWHVKKLKGIL